MSDERSRPAIGRLAGALRSGIVDSTTSPRSPLDYDQQGGVGLGLVVALEKPNSNRSRGGEVIAKYAICSRSNHHHHHQEYNNNNDEMMVDEEEEFTYVTCHGPNKSFTTRVYYDGGEYSGCRSGRNGSVFKISPARFSGERWCSGSDFLSSCYLCRKALHGMDIYMYRGEKAFCSAECRQRQIGIDERKERCRSEASRTTQVSSSPYTYTSRGPIFSTEIVAV